MIKVRLDVVRLDCRQWIEIYRHPSAQRQEERDCGTTASAARAASEEAEVEGATGVRMHEL